MILRIRLVVWYILSCIRIFAPPWKYFQLNAPFFNEDKGIFSKLEMDQRIPARWRLQQYSLDIDISPNRYPVFIKPEWGQNGRGIERADNKQQFDAIKQKLAQHKSKYLVQYAADETREFEVFYIRKGNCPKNFAVLTITEAVNSSSDGLPVNSIFNPQTRYKDTTPKLSQADKLKLWSYINQLGHYRIARVGIRADSIQQILSGDFHIIEINLYIPLPLRLLDSELPQDEKLTFIRSSMLDLAKATKAIPREQKNKGIFFRKLRVHYTLKSDVNIS